MGDGGKGDSPRPLGVDRLTFENNWDLVFGKSTKSSATIIESKETPVTTNSESPLWVAGAVYRKEE